MTRKFYEFALTLAEVDLICELTEESFKANKGNSKKTQLAERIMSELSTVDAKTPKKMYSDNPGVLRKMSNERLFRKSQMRKIS